MEFTFNSLRRINKSMLYLHLKAATSAYTDTLVNNTPFQRCYSDSNLKESHLHYYTILQIANNSDQEEVRKAFLRSVKRYHPDSGSPEANEEKFHQIETAYRKLQDKFASERWNVNDDVGEYGLYYKEKKAKEFENQHIVPQHRQYLSNEGYGYGTPQQRQKQFQKMRAYTAVMNVYNHRMAKLTQTEEQALVTKDKREASKIKIRSEMERLVEDLIQESISRGDFKNLAGMGKPLQRQNNNPYVDFVTQKMNQMLIDNGFTPAWITLQKDISHSLRELRSSLAEARMCFGTIPLVGDEVLKWKKVLDAQAYHIKELNKKINDFNLQVPLLNKQMVLIKLEREADNILRTGKTKFDVVRKETHEEQQAENQDPYSIFGFLEEIFTKA